MSAETAPFKPVAYVCVSRKKDDRDAHFEEMTTIGFLLERIMNANFRCNIRVICAKTEEQVKYLQTADWILGAMPDQPIPLQVHSSTKSDF